MGTWGTSLFSDDTASDVRGDFRDYLGDGKSTEEATQLILKDYEGYVDDPDDGPVFWLALASTQWKLGRLLDWVRDRAIQVIDAGADLEQWAADNPKDLPKRKAVLEKLRAELLSPQPAPKKVAKRYRDTTPFEVGDVISYRTRAGKFVLFRVIGHHEDKGGRSPVAELLDWVGERSPEEKEIRKMKPLQHPVWGSKMLLGAVSAREYPADRVSLVMKGSKPAQKMGRHFVELWRGLDDSLERQYGIQ